MKKSLLVGLSVGSIAGIDSWYDSQLHCRSYINTFNNPAQFIGCTSLVILVILEKVEDWI